MPFRPAWRAISPTVLAIVGAGDRIVAVRNCYGDAYRFFESFCRVLASQSIMSTAPMRKQWRPLCPAQSCSISKAPHPWCSSCRTSRDYAKLPSTRASRPHGQFLGDAAVPAAVAHGIDLVCIRLPNISVATVTLLPVWSPGRKANDRADQWPTHSYLGAKLAPFEAFLLSAACAR